MNNYISPGQAWLRFALWAFVGLGALGGIVYLATLVLRIRIDSL